MKKILLALLLFCFPAWAAIDLTGNIQTGFADYATDLVITKPTGTVDNDMLVAVVIWDARSTTITPPSGWTTIATSTTAYGDWAGGCYRKRASSEGATYTWTMNSYYLAYGSIQRIPGVITTGDPLDSTTSTTASNDGGTTISSTSITTGTNNSAVIQLGVTHGDYTSLSATTLTERLDNGLWTFITGDVQATAGASGAKTGTLGVSHPWITFMISLKEAAAASPATNNTFRSLLGVGR
jgi:hypothetical protein